jgi:hypothetical protein
MGLPDDCHELQTLRKFRDDILLGDESGSALVERYYEVAPRIVSQLTTKDLEEVWSTVLKCVQAIERGDHARAIDLYKSTIESLQRRFGVNDA